MEDGITAGLVGLIISDRADHAPEVQEVLTRFGGIITSRMGTPSRDRERGFITLTVEGGRGQIAALTAELSKVEGVRVTSSLIDD